MDQSKQTNKEEVPRKDADSSPQDSRRAVLLLAGLTTLAILTIAALAVFSTTGGPDVGSFTPNNQGLLPIGSQAPDFAAQTIDGSSVSLGDAGGKEATMLVFFATWCPHCNREAPIISELQDEYKDLQVIMVGIDGRDDPGKVREFVDRYGIGGPAVYQPSLGHTYQVSGYPTIYILDGDKKVVAAHSGEAPKEVYKNWIEQALASGG